MKIVLYILLGLIGLVILFFGGAILYIKYFDKPAVAEIQLQPEGIFDDTIISRLSETVQELRNGTQISIAYTSAGQTHYYGVKRDDDIIKSDINQSAVYEIGSITKVMTAYVIHRLAQQGALDIEDSVLDHLPIDNANLSAVTIKTLINHTSGLDRMPGNLELMFKDDPYKDYTKQDLYDYLQSIDIEIIESEQEYSNLGYGVLGAIAEEISGIPIGQVYDQYIFDSLDMKNSSFYLDSVNNVVPPGNGPIDEPSSHWNFEILGAAGAVKSSVDQMALWLDHLLEQDSIALSMQTESLINSEHSSTGLGLFISKKGGQPLYWHNGATGGYNSCMIYSPSDKNGIVILTNRALGAQLDSKIDHLAFKIFRHLQTQNK